MDIDEAELERDAEQARNVIAPIAQRLRGLFQLWNIFQSAKIMAQGFSRDFDSLGHEAKLAFSKAIIVDYAKPWSGNRSLALSCLLDSNREIPFLSTTIDSSNTHEALRELRNKMVAHIDEGYESLGITLKGVDVVNIPPNRPRDPNTLEQVFVPISLRLEAARGIWWISRIDKLTEVLDHIVACLDETQAEVGRCATLLRDTCFEHIHVLSRISDVVSLEAFPPTENSTQSHTSHDFQSSSNLVPQLNLVPATEVIFGDDSLQGLVSILEPDPSLPGNSDIPGRGYRLKITEPDENASVTWNVVFPRYPYPAEAP